METVKTPKTDQSIKVNFEVKRGDNVYTFSMPYQCPLGEAYDVAYEVLADIVSMSQRAYEKARQENKKDESTPVEEAK